MRRLAIVLAFTCVALAAAAGTAFAEPAAAEASATGRCGEPLSPGNARETRVNATVRLDADGDGTPEHEVAAARLDAARFAPGAAMTAGLALVFFDAAGEEREPDLADPASATEIRSAQAKLTMESDGDAATRDDQTARVATP